MNQSKLEKKISASYDLSEELTTIMLFVKVSGWQEI